MQQLAALDDQADKLLLVSDRTLYLLANLAEFDITLYARYASMRVGERYVPVESGTADAVLVDSYVNAFQLEVNPMATNVRTVSLFGTEFVYQNYVPGFGANEAVAIGAPSLPGGDVFWDSPVPALGHIYRLLGFVAYYIGELATVNLFIGAKHTGTRIPFWKQAPAANGIPYVAQVDVPICYPDVPYLEAQGLGASEAAYAVLYGVYVEPEAAT